MASPISRRHFLRSHGFNLGALALPWLLQRDAASAAPTKPFTDGLRFDLSPKPPPSVG